MHKITINSILIGILILFMLFVLDNASWKNDVVKGSVVMTGDDIPAEWTSVINNRNKARKTHLYINGKEQQLGVDELYIADDEVMMISLKAAKEIFKCAVNYETRDSVQLQKRNLIIDIDASESVIYSGSDKIKVPNVLVLNNGKHFINVAVFKEGFSYGYSWNSSKDTLSMVDVYENQSVLPSSYSYADADRLPQIKNQGRFGTCWAFAALGAVESSLMPYEKYLLSVDNLVNSNTYGGNNYDGGDYLSAIAYLTSWRGPVNDSDDPYGDGESNPYASAVKHVQEARLIESKNNEAIKEAVFLYGGVESCLFMNMNYVGERSQFYNQAESAYCYIGTNKANHDVVIVGWDDNYPKENFRQQVEGNGAYICMNSWGQEFGEDGLFYVSYYDSIIGTHNVVYTGVDSIDNYNNIYQSDLCGKTGQLGYNASEAYFANVYQAEYQEKLEAVGFYTTGKNTFYDIYLVENYTDEDSFNNKVYIQSGKMANEGYYTVELKKSLKLVTGEKFAIVVMISTPGANRPIAVEYAHGDKVKDIDLTDGEGYISMNAKNWEHVEETKDCNICLKAYTNIIDKIETDH